MKNNKYFSLSILTAITLCFCITLLLILVYLKSSEPLKGSQTFLYPMMIQSIPTVQADSLSFFVDSFGRHAINTLTFKPLKDTQKIDLWGEIPHIWEELNLCNNQPASLVVFIDIGRHEKSTVYIKYINTQFKVVGIMGEKNNKIRGIDIDSQEVVRLILPPNEIVKIRIEIHSLVEKYLKREIKPILYKDMNKVKVVKGLAYYKNRYSVILHFFLLGFFLFQIFWIGFQCYQLRGLEYYYYFTYSIALFVYYFSKIEYTDGLYLFFTYAPQWTTNIGKALPLFAYLMYCYFFGIVFKIKNNFPHVHPFLDTLLKLMTVLLLFDIVAVTGLNKTDLEAKVVTFIIPLLAIGSFLIVTYVWYKQQDAVSNRIMLGSITFLIAASLSHILSNYIWIQEFLGDTILSREPLLPMGVGSVVEVYLFSTALAYKSKLADEHIIKTTQKMLDSVTELQEMRENFWRKLHSDIKSDIATILSKLQLVKHKLEQKDNIEKIEDLIDDVFELSEDVSGLEWINQSKLEYNTIGALTQKLKKVAERKCTAVEPNITFYSQFYLDNPESVLDFKMKEGLFYLIKQAMSNAIEHSQCHLREEKDGFIALNIRYTEGVSIDVEIEDNGIGFNSTTLKAVTGRGNGVIDMKNLAEKMGGHFRIDSQIMEGTKIIFSKKLV